MREIPKLADSNCHIEAEQIEAFIVSQANTGLSPHTMMIHFVLALSTSTTMRYSWKFIVVALMALFMSA